MAEVSLTRGAIATITVGGATEEDLKPILQVTEVRLVSTTQTTREMYRMMLSDGVSLQQAMLATQMHFIVKSGQLQKGSIVQLTKYICNTIQGRRIIFVISLEVLDKSDVIGMPKIYDSGSAMSLSQTPMPSQSSGMVQPSATGGNPPYGGSHSGIPIAGQSAMWGASLPLTTEPTSNNSSYDGSYARSMNNVNFLHPKAEHGAGTFTDSHLNGGNQSHRFSNQPMGGGYRPPGNAYGRSGQPSCQQPPPLYTNRGTVAKNEAPARIIPTEALAEVSLTRGAIATITEGGAAAEGLKPILQVTEVRLVSTTQTTTERYRIMLSDGVSQQQGMFATQKNAIVKSGQLQKGSIVQLTEYVCNTIQGHRIIIIISLEVLDKSDAIGAPKIYDSGSTMSQNRAPMPAQSSGMVQPSATGGSVLFDTKFALQYCIGLDD